jgi:hypothetical protein
MTDDALAKWRLLLAQTEVKYKWTDHLSTRSAEQLLEFESRAELILPTGYKEYCQVFGYGRFGINCFSIECPPLEDVEGGVILNRDVISAAKGAYPYPEDVLRLLDSALLFGLGDGYILFGFDLRTYSDSDESYNIFAIGEKSIDTVYNNIGRDFLHLSEICV